MDELLFLQRIQHHAASAIQRAYRKYKRMEYWKEFLVKSAAVVKIQRVARGFVTRRLVRRWFARRNHMVVIVQSLVRRYLARKHARILREIYDCAALIIQKVFRGVLTRRALRLQRLHRAAAMIQRLWRGAVGRARADRLWVNRCATKVQRLGRGMLDRLRSQALRKELNGAARQLQRHFRGLQARRVRNRLLWERDLDQRRMLIKVLFAEFYYWSQEAKRWRSILDRERIDEKCAPATILSRNLSFLELTRRRVEDLMQQCRSAREQIRVLEFDFLALQKERRLVSPRAVEQGWALELDKYVLQYRSRVTNAKLDYLFGPNLELSRIRERKEALEAQQAEALRMARAVEKWREEELSAMWKVRHALPAARPGLTDPAQRDNEIRWRTMKRQKQMRVAEEKRKWTLRFYT
jgi:hypothetical protein